MGWHSGTHISSAGVGFKMGTRHWLDVQDKVDHVVKKSGLNGQQFSRACM